MITLDFLHNLDLLFVGIAIAISFLLGLVIYLNDRTSTTNSTVLLFSITAIFWNICNYAFYQIELSEFALPILRLIVFFAIGYCFMLFRLFYVFPNKSIAFPSWYKKILLPWVFFVAVLTLTPLVFKRIIGFSTDGRVSGVENGVGVGLFGITVLGLILGAIYFFLIKYRQADLNLKKPIRLITIGAIITFTLHIIFNMVLPAFFDRPEFTPLGAIFSLPFIAFTAYATIRHGLFNVKVIATQLLTFALWIFILMRTILATTLYEQVINGVLLVVTVGFGFLLIKSVVREIEQREKIEKLAGELQIANDQQSNLIHFITHQVKGFFTMSRNIFSLMLENTYGEITPEMKRAAQQGFDNSTKGVTTVQEVLSAANIKKGTVTFSLDKVNLKPIVEEAFKEFKPKAEEKGLAFNLISSDVTILADEPQIRHVIRNLIDNSVRYTLKGSVTVRLTKDETNALYSVEDTGVGITDEDKKRLFTEGGRGKESIKVNVDSTGFGLYIVKGIVEAHKGKIVADSAGAGKGSAFRVTIPLYK